MELDHKLCVLEQIARQFNDNHITWAVGASLLLYFKGIVPRFHDIDIVIDEQDAATVKALLSHFGSLQPPSPNARYGTREFLEYVIDGVEVDVMAGFSIITDQGEHFFPLQKGGVHDFTTVGGVAIPLQSLTEWRLYYSLMGRQEKVALLDAALGQAPAR